MVTRVCVDTVELGGQARYQWSRLGSLEENRFLSNAGELICILRKCGPMERMQ